MTYTLLVDRATFMPRSPSRNILPIRWQHDLALEPLTSNAPVRHTLLSAACPEPDTGVTADLLTWQVNAGPPDLASRAR